MRLDHIALWTTDIERCKQFYVAYFGAVAGPAQRMGLTHIAICAGSPDAVDTLTRRLRGDGFPIIDGPRRTGDGYYESVVLDPDGNRVEIMA